MDSEVADEEQIANFILESNKFRPDGTVHPRAFLPGKNDGERSVMRISGLSAEYTAATGQAFVGNLRDRKVLGWGQISAAEIRSPNALGIALDVVSDVPPPRHALINGWPPERERRDALALLLASKAKPRRWPEDT
jgi:hypothetical protein